MDLPSRSRWYDYSHARDMMLEATDTPFAPWYILRSDDKKRARLNCISHLLSLIPYQKIPRDKVTLPTPSKRTPTMTRPPWRAGTSSRSTIDRRVLRITLAVHGHRHRIDPAGTASERRMDKSGFPSQICHDNYDER